MKLGRNTGTITASEGVTGTLTVLENTGTITVPSGVTLVTYTYASTKLVQTITAAGLSSSELTDTARLKALECAIQEAIGVSDCMNVAVTGVAAARRADSAITYEVSPHKQTLCKVSIEWCGCQVTYQESELATISANMAAVNSNPSGTVGAAILSSLQSITGVTSITVTATAANTEARGGSQNSNSESDNSTMWIVIGICVGAVGAIAAVVVFVMMRKGDSDPDAVVVFVLPTNNNKSDTIELKEDTQLDTVGISS